MWGQAYAIRHCCRFVIKAVMHNMHTIDSHAYQLRIDIHVIPDLVLTVTP